MFVSISAVLPIFLLIITGCVLKRYFLGSEEFWKSAEALTYYFLFPLLLVLKISSVNFGAQDSLRPIGITVLVTLFVGLLTFAFKAAFGISNSLFTSIFQGSVRYNSYVFLAMSESLLGPKFVGLTGVFIAYMIVVTNILSVVVMNRYGEGEKKTLSSVVHKIVTNPLILGAAAGGILNYFNVHIDGFLKEYMTMLEAAASPLSLLAVGAGLRLTMASKKKYAVTLALGLKLLLMPLVTLGVILCAGITGEAATVAILYASLPCAGNAYILARQMGGDTESISSIITFSTLLSMITCPAYLLMSHSINSFT